ncbi:Uncharacterised protein [Mycobacterium tuberculosis]|nr:Uncharacterised protein [Mycobacterium tuberculosis]
MSAPQQESRHGEEHRHRQIEAAEQPPAHTARVPGLERDVSDHDADGRACAHSLDGGQKATGPTHHLAVGHQHSVPVRCLRANRCTRFVRRAHTLCC